MRKAAPHHATVATFALIVSVALCCSSVARGDPADKVILPSVVQGELEFELLGGYQQWPNHDGDRERQFIGEVGYGLASWWKSELGAGTTRFPSASYHLDELEWENIFALTEPGEYWLDLSLLAELERDYGAGVNLIKVGPLLQNEFGPVQTNLNLFVTRELGNSAAPGAEIDYQWQAKWRGDPGFEPGAQGFGTIGRTNDFGHQAESRVGPAFFGQIATGPRHKLKYDAAVLFGLNHNTADTMVRFQIEYEMN